jgi:AraC family transcriptional regulator
VTTTPLAHRYALRLRNVLDFIEAHLDGDLSVERLSGVAAFSKFHFHRQFSSLFGVGVHRYVKLLRLRRATLELAFRRERRILDVALDSGYESHEAFTRAFKLAFGQSPSQFRERPDWEPWRPNQQCLLDLRNQFMKPEHRPSDVSIVDFAETRVAILEHRGAPERIGDSIRTFIEWRKSTGARPPKSATYNLLYGDPNAIPPAEFRCDLCAGIDRPVADNESGVVEGRIPAGRCAKLRHMGSDDTLGATLSYLYASWLPESGEELRDFPLFVQRVTFFPDVTENEAVTDVFLPLE